MRKIKAVIYAIMGSMLCWNTYQQGQLSMTIGIAFFSICAIAITLAGIGKHQITWDAVGVTIKRFPAAPTQIAWSDMQRMKVDHLGYHIQAKHGQFRVSRSKMPENLRVKIKESIRTNTGS